MSASTPVSTPPPVPPATVAARRGSPLAGFFIDLGIAIVAMIGLSVVAGMVWGLYRGAIIGAQIARDGGAVPAGAALTEQMGEPGALAQVLMALVATGGTALLVYAWRRRATSVERQASRRAALRPSTWGWTLLVATVVVLGSNGLGYLFKQFGVQPVPTNQALMQHAVSQFPAFLVVFAVLLAPAYEELLFRRALFGRLWQAGRPWLGMVLSSLAFALVHEIPGTSANGPAEIAQLWLIYGGMGAAFCWLYQRTGTLWAPIAAHALNNAVALAVLVLVGVQ
ncbi:CPBP family intramembrane glutamic endopeptidase [Stenotrophomonas sp. 24(2023)]|uniref:CPBP family intramembrane glutamic endopeptidase n=1 Tax=Stenotrophomonas sp. 24(2023) TaxID=3068324 RepID=UPI0027E1AB59|nr:CPBP family intramembrane glutamic endopeptidase [Stenotrophomonas sp. 24(2023)]WMJ71090.1 CPBP family intramembrane glutamic endopeptidase [Stenotrophomonas sp. 24(2023)]